MINRIVITLNSNVENLFVHNPPKRVIESLTMNRKRDFLDSIRVEGDSEMVYLKIKLENGEIKAIDLTDEQIDELQEIYDKEIEEKKNKIKKLKSVA